MFERTVLPNGLRIVSATLTSVRSVSIAFFVGAGSRYERAEMAGVSHFLEHLLFKGTPTYPTPGQISELIEGVGGSMNAATDKELTVYYAKVGAQHFERTFGVLCDILVNPLFAPDEVEKERKVILEELAMTEDSPPDLTGLLIDEMLWPDQPLGRDAGGTPESVKALTRDEITAYFRAQYGPKNVVLAVAGNVSHEQVVDEAGRNFAAWPDCHFERWLPVVSRERDERARLRRKKTEQTHFSLAVHAYHADHPDRFALDLLSTILGEGMSSRLFLDIRERRALAYDVSSYVERFADTGAALISASVDPLNAAETVRVIAGHLAAIHEPVRESELERAREYLKGRLVLRMEDTGAVASWLGRQELLRERIMTVDEALAHLDRVEIEDIRRVAEELFRPERLQMAVVGPYRSIKTLERALG